MDNMAKTLGAGYPLLCMAQEHEGFAVHFVFPALHPGQPMPAAKLPPTLQGVGLGSGQAAGGEADHSSSE